ncbi:MAG: Hsp20/alpha crystallin family protein [Sneathiellales bacterium]|nr:Hsp20/alpha crystallin family protein [Sneathiellales bacterium]
MVSKVPIEHSHDWWPDFFQPLRQVGTRIADFFSPSAEAGSTGSHYTVRVELPGVKEEDIDIALEDGILKVKGEKHSKREEKSETCYFSERTFGSFQRSFRLPADIRAEDIKAHFENGVLELEMPKTAPTDKEAFKIPIGKRRE